MPALEREFGQLYFRDSGDGDPSVILLHEYFGSGESWAAQRAYLARFARVVTPDLRGHGRSVMDDGRLSLSAIAEDVRAIQHHLGLTASHFIGCSLGALVALHLARTAPSSAASIAVSSVPYLRNPNATAYARKYIDDIFPTLEAGLDRVHGNGEPGYTRQRLLHNFELDLEELPHDHLAATEQAAQIGCPILIISGDRDPVFDARSALDLANATPGASLAVVPATGHLVHREMPGLLNELVLDHVVRSTDAG